MHARAPDDVQRVKQLLGEQGFGWLETISALVAALPERFQSAGQADVIIVLDRMITERRTRQEH